MELILSNQRFRKVPFSSVYTYTQKQRFQKVPLWRALSKNCVFIDRFHRTRVYGSRIRKEKVAFSNGNGYVWTGPKKRGNIRKSSGSQFRSQVVEGARLREEH